MSRLRVIIILIVGSAFLAAMFLLPLGRWALALVEQVRGFGSLGIAIYGAVYALAVVGFIPGSLLTIGAGFVYGLAGGTALVVPSAILGATLAFLLGRTVARDWVNRQMTRYRRLKAVDEAISEHGLSVILLLRLSPLFPFGLLNYALGVTRVRTRDYIIATAIGIIPGTFLYVYIGTLITSAAALAAGERPDAGIAERVLFWGGLVITAVVTVWVSRLARKKLDSTLEQTE